MVTSKTDRVKGRFPPWLRKRLSLSPAAGKLRQLLGSLELLTVCREARCPNLWECFSRSTATFMILGARCTRNCRFCAVHSGVPQALDPDEPARVAEAACAMGLKHVVVTSVTRDDLRDGGAAHFARVIRELREAGDFTLEVLTPDFGGSISALNTVIAARPDVFGHNLETVDRLYPEVRPGADYGRSLGILAEAKRLLASICTKSGLMLGLGETEEEVLRSLADLRQADCEVVTLGQYLCPSDRHYPIQRFIPPAEFDYFREEALKMGFASVSAGPFVRSSYLADQQFELLKLRKRRRQKRGVHG